MNMEAKILRLQTLSKNHKVSVEEFEAIRQETLRQEEEKRTIERINQFIQQVPFRFRGKKFIDYKVENESQERVKKIADRYVQTFEERIKEGTPIKFLGKPGTGKTFLALIIYQELAKAGYSVKYTSSLEFIKGLLEIKFKSQQNYQSHLEKYQNVQLLILDEVTESINKDGFPSEIERQALFKIIDHRYENSLCTLIISNRSNEALIERLGSPIVDRLSQNGIALAFNWDSYRQK